MQPNRRLFLFAAALLLVGAAFLRFQQIDRRPFHADEAVQAYQTWQLMRGAGYTYDPADKHGPLLYYATAGIAKISGWTPATLSESHLRSITLWAGLGTIVLLLANGAALGRGTVLIASALLAVAPLAIIYDTYFIQEAWFCFLTWALFFAALRWSGNDWDEISLGVGRDRWARRKDSAGRQNGRPSGPSLPSIPRKPSLAGAVLIGVLAGLMQATKETSVLHFAALGVAFVALRWSALTSTRLGRAAPEPAHWGQFAPPVELEGPSPDGPRPVGRRALQEEFYPVLVALLTFLFVYILFYSAFFTRWTGVADGILSYFNYAARAAGSAHDQPWYYYLAILWPHAREGVRLGEPLLLIAAVIGTIFAFTSRANSLQRTLAVFTLTLLFLYSVIPYKMPWLLLTPYVGLTLLAGFGVVGLADYLPAKFGRFVPATLGLVLVVAAFGMNFKALGRYANDDRNAYVYQPTSADLVRLVASVNSLPVDRKIAVVSPDHAWPLPWYWRDRSSIGYFAVPPANLAAYDLVLFDSRFDSPLPASVSVYGLRPNVILWCKQL